jgi:hypothetical protein
MSDKTPGIITVFLKKHLSSTKPFILYYNRLCIGITIQPIILFQCRFCSTFTLKYYLIYEVFLIVFTPSLGGSSVVFAQEKPGGKITGKPLEGATDPVLRPADSRGREITAFAKIVAVRKNKEGLARVVKPSALAGVV